MMLNGGDDDGNDYDALIYNIKSDGEHAMGIVKHIMCIITFNSFDNLMIWPLLLPTDDKQGYYDKTISPISYR